MLTRYVLTLLLGALCSLGCRLRGKPVTHVKISRIKISTTPYWHPVTQNVPRRITLRQIKPMLRLRCVGNYDFGSAGCEFQP